MPQIMARTQDPFFVTELCEWADSEDIENLEVSEPDEQNWVTVTLYGISKSDRRFARFAEHVARDGWVSGNLAGRDLSRIIVERTGSLWRAFFEAHSSIGFLDPVPSQAMRQLCEDFEVGIDRLSPGDSPSMDRLVALVRPLDSAICPDCNGTGKYHGFLVVEGCRLCGGSGQFASPGQGV